MNDHSQANGEQAPPPAPSVPASNIDDIHIRIQTSPDPPPPASDGPEPGPPRGVVKVQDSAPRESMTDHLMISEEHKGDIILGAQLSAAHSAPTTPLHRFASEEKIDDDDDMDDAAAPVDDASYQTYQLKERTGSMDLRGAASPSAGTLAELKRQRMQQHLGSRRSGEREGDGAMKASDGSVDRCSTSSNGTTPLLDNNNKLAHAQSNSVSPAPYHHPPSSAYQDPPRHKFKAQETEIVGGDEVKPRCCTIL